jgi:hypothetical protein
MGNELGKVVWCPMCRTKIIKSEGCDHMTCRYCSYEFCYICGGDYFADSCKDLPIKSPCLKYFLFSIVAIFAVMMIPMALLLTLPLGLGIVSFTKVLEKFEY